jgi:hypothetical protein
MRSSPTSAAARSRLRCGAAALGHSSPSIHSQSTPTPAHLQVDTGAHGMAPPPGPSYGGGQRSGESYRSPPPSAGGQQLPPPQGYGPQHYQGQGQTLPPISSIQHGMSVPSMRYHGEQPQQPQQQQHHPHGHAHPHAPGVSSSLKRQGVTASNATSADSSDVDEDEGELPTQGMVAPWEVLRGLADVAIERAKKVGFRLCFWPSRP